MIQTVVLISTSKIPTIHAHKCQDSTVWTSTKLAVFQDVTLQFQGWVQKHTESHPNRHHYHHHNLKPHMEMNVCGSLWFIQQTWNTDTAILDTVPEKVMIWLTYHCLKKTNYMHSSMSKLLWHSSVYILKHTYKNNSPVLWHAQCCHTTLISHVKKKKRAYQLITLCTQYHNYEAVHK